MNLRGLTIEALFTRYDGYAALYSLAGDEKHLKIVRDVKEEIARRLETTICNRKERCSRMSVFEKFTVIGLFADMQDEEMNAVGYLSSEDILDIDKLVPSALVEMAPAEVQQQAKDFVGRIMEELRESYAKESED